MGGTGVTDKGTWETGDQRDNGHRGHEGLKNRRDWKRQGTGGRRDGGRGLTPPTTRPHTQDTCGRTRPTTRDTRGETRPEEIPSLCPSPIPPHDLSNHVFSNQGTTQSLSPLVPTPGLGVRSDPSTSFRPPRSSPSTSTGSPHGSGSSSVTSRGLTVLHSCEDYVYGP